MPNTSNAPQLMSTQIRAIGGRFLGGVGDFGVRSGRFFVAGIWVVSLVVMRGPSSVNCRVILGVVGMIATHPDPVLTLGSLGRSSVLTFCGSAGNWPVVV